MSFFAAAVAGGVAVAAGTAGMAAGTVAAGTVAAGTVTAGGITGGAAVVLGEN